MANFSNLTNLSALIGRSFQFKQSIPITLTNASNATYGYYKDGHLIGQTGNQPSSSSTFKIVSVSDGVGILGFNDSNQVATGTVITRQNYNSTGSPTGGQTYYLVGGQDANGLVLLNGTYDSSSNTFRLLFDPDADPQPQSVGGSNLYLIADPNTVSSGTAITATYNAPPPATFAAAGVACFTEGTLIRTPEGDRPVETLQPGDWVSTAAGASRRVKWLATSFHRPSTHPRPREIHPVRIRAGAFGEGLPQRDLRLSPGHAVFVDGVLMPAGHLVNGATIVADEVESVRYYHVELDSHDVLLAEGLPCESYLDDGNRATFANAEGAAELHGRLDPKSWDDACAPLVAAGSQLAEVRQRLHARALELGWTQSEEPELHLAADGAQVAPLHRSGNRFWFAVPACGELAIRSGSGVLAHVMPSLEDFRRLGVAVTEVRVDGATLSLTNKVFGEGFHAVEQHGDATWRWTDGDARIHARLEQPAMIEVHISMVAPHWKREAPRLSIVA
jgi:hypothetical protein